MSDRFFSIHAQGMVRVAAATPLASAGDPACNAAAILALAQEGAAAGADLLVFPELSLSSYAIDAETGALTICRASRSTVTA